MIVKSYEQRYDIHYTKIYAFVVNLRTVRTLLSLTAHQDLEIHQMNVKTAFLNASLSETERTRIAFSHEFESTDESTQSLLLLKSSYDLTQALFL